MATITTKFRVGQHVKDVAGDSGTIEDVDFAMGYSPSRNDGTFEINVIYKIKGDKGAVTMWRSEGFLKDAPEPLSLTQTWARIGVYIQKTAPLICSGCGDVTGDETVFKTVRYNAYKILWSNGYKVTNEDKDEVRALIREAVN